jgi:hypothetical protein
MRIVTNRDLETAIARLSRRSPESLAAFITSLAQDSGPIGEQVRTFIVGDDLNEAMASIKERIDQLRHLRDRSHRQHSGEVVGQRLDALLDAIQTLVLPRDPRGALELLLLLIERDADAMESCGDYHDSVQSAVDRAAGLIAKAGQSQQPHEVRMTLTRLVAEDAYGTRRSLAAVMEAFAQGGS